MSNTGQNHSIKFAQAVIGLQAVRHCVNVLDFKIFTDVMKELAHILCIVIHQRVRGDFAWNEQ